MSATSSRHTWSCVEANPLTAHRRRPAFLAHLRTCGTPESDFSAAAIIYGELVGNVVRHTQGGVEVRLAWKRLKAELRVRDFGRGFDHAFRLPEATSESGRGLFIVRQLAEAIDISCDVSGCEVTAVLPVTHSCVI